MKMGEGHVSHLIVLTSSIKVSEGEDIAPPCVGGDAKNSVHAVKANY